MKLKLMVNKSWDSTTRILWYPLNLIKNSVFSSNKTHKIANKPTKSMKNAETVRTRTLS